MVDYLLIGNGIVGSGILQYLQGNIVIVDKQKTTPFNNKSLNQISFVEENINKQNYKEILSTYSKPKTIIIETAVEIDTRDLAIWCHENNRYFVNSSCCSWLDEMLLVTNNLGNIDGKVHLYVDRLKPILTHKGPTVLLTHGTNPGMVNHYLNYCIFQLSVIKNQSIEKIISQIKEIYILEKENLLFTKNFIREENKFYNTWNISDFFIESIAHVDYPDISGVQTYKRAHNKLVLLDKMLINGRIVSHEETFTMQHYLEKKFNQRCKIQFIYECSDIGDLSRKKFKLGEDYIPVCTRSELDPVKGYDMVGTIVILNDQTNWFCGYSMTQKEAIQAFNKTNATAWFVSASLLAAIKWITHNPSKGIIFPEMIGVNESKNIIKIFNSYCSGKNFISQSIKNLYISPEMPTYECINLHDTSKG